MNQFTDDDKEHRQHFALLYDSHDVEEKFKKACILEATVIKGKEENRVKSMVDIIDQTSIQGSHFRRNAVTRLIFAKDNEEAMAVHLGSKRGVTTGVMLCPECLDKTIMLMEDHLEALKDLREATKAYATVKS